LVTTLEQDIIPTNIAIQLDNDPINMSSKRQAWFGQFWTLKWFMGYGWLLDLAKGLC